MKEMMMTMLSTEINGIASFPEMTPSNLLILNLNHIKMFLFTGRTVFAKSQSFILQINFMFVNFCG